MAVAVCLAALLVPLASEFSDADGHEYSQLFYYTISNKTESDGSITVTVSDAGVGTTPVSGTTQDGCESAGSWVFSETTGIGPFNSFYAAFDPYNDNAMIGILDPYDLTKLIDGGDISWQACNIMWVVPTVYWYVNDSGLNLTNDKEKAESNSGEAYAHTIDDHVYDYIAIGVYEAYVDEDTGYLTSFSGVTPTTNMSRSDFRSCANSQSVVVDTTAGHAMVWNFYQYELYKYCCVAVMASWDSQTAIGNGSVCCYDLQTTGNLDQSGPYAGTRGTTSAACQDSVKLFIENAWGSAGDFVDGVVVFKQANVGDYLTLYTDQSSEPTDSTSGSYVKDLGEVFAKYGYGASPSKVAAIWGFPGQTSGSSDTADSDKELCDIYWPDSESFGQDCTYSLVVGGFSNIWYNDGEEIEYETGKESGISYINFNIMTTDDPGTERLDYNYFEVIGARLAFVFDTSSEMTGVLSFDANGGTGNVPDSVTSGSFVIDDGYEITYGTQVPTRVSYEFLGWSRNPDATAADYASGGSVRIWGDTVLYAVWESNGDDGGNGGDGGGRSGPVYSYTVEYDANGGSGAPATQRYTSSSTRATLTIPSTEPTRSGYTFVGWSADPSATTAEYYSTGTITLTSDGTFSTSVTLYAVWTTGSSSGSGSGGGSGDGSGSDSGSGGSGDGSGSGRSGSGDGSGSGGSDGGSDNSDWWIWLLIILIIIILVAISGSMGYRARNKD